MTPTSASQSKSTPSSPIRPGDFARILLASSSGPPRQRARDQQADLAGESLNRQILDRLIALDPDPVGLEEALLAIVEEMGEPSGPARGVCTSIQQTWEMLQVSPHYWTFLIEEALRNEVDRPDRVQQSRRDPGDAI
jgi:hypothetical protein